MTSISINGVCATDFLAFYGEVRRVVDNDYDRVEFALCEQTQLDEPDALDAYDCSPLWEPVRLPERWWSRHERRFETKTKRNAKFLSKRKEVK